MSFCFLIHFVKFVIVDTNTGFTNRKGSLAIPWWHACAVYTFHVVVQHAVPVCAPPIGTRSAWCSPVARRRVIVVYALPAVWFLAKKGLKITGFFCTFWSHPLTAFNINYLLTISTFLNIVCSQQGMKAKHKSAISWWTDRWGVFFFINTR